MALSAALSVFLFLAVTLTVASSLSHISASFFSFLPASRADFAEAQVQHQPQATNTSSPPPPPHGTGVRQMRLEQR